MENGVHPLIEQLTDDDGETVAYQFWCPACATIDRKHGLHVFTVKDADGDPDQEWSFDGEASFEPSLAYENEPYCHLHLTAGKLRYYPDCHNSMAGQVAEMVPIPDGEHEERE
jgi:hypothetical protein